MSVTITKVSEEVEGRPSSSSGVECDVVGIGDDDYGSFSNRNGRDRAAGGTGNETSLPEAEHCNLAGVEPKVGMYLEIRDPEYIWSSGRIVRVSSRRSSDDGDDREVTVTVRYKGWGPDWDETLPYPHPRLARLFTLTKEVKCLVGLLPKTKNESSSRGGGAVGRDTGKRIDKGKSKSKRIRKGTSGAVARKEAPTAAQAKNWTDLWPCRASFRVPHRSFRGGGFDDETDRGRVGRAEALLRAEPRAFVEPYRPDLLPASVRRRMAATMTTTVATNPDNGGGGLKGSSGGGWWWNAGKLRPWKELDFLSQDRGRCMEANAPPSSSPPFSAAATKPIRVIIAPSTTGTAAQTAFDCLLARGFDEAYHEARSDGGIVGVLPPTVRGAPPLLDGGSLVSERYRFSGPDGAARYTGAFNLSASDSNQSKGETDGGSVTAICGSNGWRPKKRVRSMSPVPAINRDGYSATGAAGDATLTRKFRSSDNGATAAFSATTTARIPPPIEVVVEESTLRPDGGRGFARRLERSHRWVGTARMGGNDAFLGAYASRREARKAAAVALSPKWGGSMGGTMSGSAVDRATIEAETEAFGHVADMDSIPVESIVSAMEQGYDPNVHHFSVRDWAMATPMPQYRDGVKGGGLLERRKERKQSLPRRLNLRSRHFVS